MTIKLENKHIDRAGRKWNGLVCPLACLVNDYIDIDKAYAHIAKGCIRIIKAGENRQLKRSVIWSSPMTQPQREFARDYDIGMVTNENQEYNNRDKWLGLEVEIPDNYVL